MSQKVCQSVWLLSAVLVLTVATCRAFTVPDRAADSDDDSLDIAGGWPAARKGFVEYLNGGGDLWEIPETPRLVLISELGTERAGTPVDESAVAQKAKRDSDGGPSLSVVNHLDVLRQKLLMEMARRRMQKSQSQIIANQNLLRQIGKRATH